MNAKPEFFRVCSDFFVWTGNAGVCDVTDLPPEMPIHRSCVEPFDVVSSKTGKVITFEFLRELTRGVGCDIEISGWRYVSSWNEFVIDIIND